jgi:hypothetical protein
MWALSSRVKRSGSEPDHSLPISADAKKIHPLDFVKGWEVDKHVNNYQLIKKYYVSYFSMMQLVYYQSHIT